MTRFEKDDFFGELFLIAPKLRNKPEGLKAKGEDPFSSSRIKQHKILKIFRNPVLPITVVENGFPIFTPDGGVPGRQEILVEGEKSRGSFCDYSIRQITVLLDVFCARAKILRQDPSLKYLVMFKNEGRLAGASQPHPHSQIFGLSFVPERWKRLHKSRKDWHSHALRLAVPELTIYRDSRVVAFANPAGKYEYEVRIKTLRRIDNITETTPAERRSLAAALHALFPLMKKRQYDFNFYFHDVIGDDNEPFEIRFAPRLYIYGGFNIDTGLSVNSVPPEIAAEEYRAS